MSHVGSKAVFLVLICLGFSAALAETPAGGTLSPDEARVLWDRANSEFEKANYEAAAHALRRLTSRVPTHAHALESQKLLGECELRLGRYTEAKAAFELYLNNTQGRGEGSNDASTRLAEAHLRAGEPTQALLIAEKLLKKAGAAGQPRWNRPLDSQLQKVRALVALGQRKRAATALQMAQKRPLVQSAEPESAKAWMESLGFELKALECDSLRLPATKLDESQVIDLVRRHALCIQELATARPAIAPAQPLPRSQAAAAWERSIGALKKSCEGPAESALKGPSSNSERTFFMRELRRKLRESCEPVLGGTNT